MEAKYEPLRPIPHMKTTKRTPKTIAIIASIATALTFATSSPGAVGIFGSYIGLNLNGTGNSWYGAQEWGTDIQNFNLANLGTLNYLTDSAQISGFQVQTFKSGGGDITGANLQYRVFKVGETPGTYSIVNAGFLSNAPFTAAQGSSASGGGDQNWGVNPPASLGNLLSGISTNGIYNVEVFFEATSNEGTQFSNNGGSNFVATMNVVPEPSTYALIALGTAFILWRIRRRLSTHPSE